MTFPTFLASPRCGSALSDNSCGCDENTSYSSMQFPTRGPATFCNIPVRPFFSPREFDRLRVSRDHRQGPSRTKIIPVKLPGGPGNHLFCLAIFSSLKPLPSVLIPTYFRQMRPPKSELVAPFPTWIVDPSGNSFLLHKTRSWPFFFVLR